MIAEGLHNFLYHDNEELAASIKAFESWYMDGHMLDPPNEMEMESPKVLGDLFESVAGAVLVDSNFDVELTWRVIFPFLSSFLQLHCTPEAITKHPIRNFYETCEAHGIPSRSIQFMFAPLIHLILLQPSRMEAPKKKAPMQTCLVIVKEFLVCDVTANGQHAAKRLAASKALEILSKSDFKFSDT